ncbi:MAG: TonB-dependent receptor plug domain-containing protein, partial [Prevotella sp.]|nr:TonB-dependent receptor plug domain-containing protein [Prevotella sp.]
MYKRERKVSKTMCSSLLLLSAGAMTFGSPVSVLANSVSQPLTEVTSVQQQKKVIITVVDGQNEPVVGASVMMMSSKTGVITDINGRCDIDAASGDEIRVSSVGYVAQTIKLGKGGSQRIVLLEDKQLLDEVVVVGYGTMRKSDLTGSSSTTKGSEILKMQGFNALEGLKGKAAGVNIFNNTGQPGGEMRVIIRGISTINASSSPLYIVDGVAMTDFQFLNPNDIESIEVLKDASSAAIYGARGANGVIMVTTKRGNAGKGAHIKYDGSFSVSSMARKMDVMNASEWMSAFKQGLENANQFQGMNFDTDLSKIFTDSRYFDSNGNPLYDTDWQEECSRVAVSHNHELSIQRSGDNGSSVGAFLNFTDQQGVLRNTYYKRVNAKLAYDDNPTKWLSTGINLLVNHSW